MKQQIEWVMPEGDWTDAEKNLYTKRINWLKIQTVSMAGSRFDEWYAAISEADMEYYVGAVAFAVSKFIEGNEHNQVSLPMSIHTAIDQSGIDKWWWFGINGDSVCELNEIGEIGDWSWIGVQLRVIARYKYKLLSRVYKSKTHAEWIALAKIELTKGGD
ncbi:hypothetical protein NVP3058O_057 [Vibrio phage 3.058.O._10N.286.46.B8]|nr:hypothetical protein NVP2058O_058 [Vibrio phage 2.058.O._10N.286.46.B8]AUS03127.1 hypothetical protein NVP3058O_057 [Vibrio phage 3.058.O._10N.286.46.B8]